MPLTLTDAQRECLESTGRVTVVVPCHSQPPSGADLRIGFIRLSVFGAYSLDSQWCSPEPYTIGDIVLFPERCVVESVTFRHEREWAWYVVLRREKTIAAACGVDGEHAYAEGSSGGWVRIPCDKTDRNRKKPEQSRFDSGHAAATF